MIRHPATIRSIAGALVGIVLLCAPQNPAFAQYSSGGYQRPSSGYSAPPVRRAPSNGSGYSQPSLPSSGFTSGSAGDRAMSRRGSEQALQDYQAGQRPPSPPLVERRPSPWGQRTEPVPDRRPSPGYGWSSGAPSVGSGIVQGLALWALLNSLSSPGRVDQFRSHQNDPEYRRWRQEAEQRAATDPEVAGRLRQLDTELAKPPERPPARGGASGLLMLVLVVGGGALVLLWLHRRRAAPIGAVPAGKSPDAPAGLRVGMTFPADPSPFVLAASSTKVKPPPGGGNITVEAIGTLRDGAVTLYRLYLPGRQAFFQLHGGPGGTIDECRYFSLLDEVAPSDAAEWAFWLDTGQGMIGWPAFQTKDGKTYGRVWGPGANRVPPRQVEETLEALGGTSQRRLQMMLYGGPTGAAAPAPPNEFVLVAAIQTPSQAWVEIHAGIDINPAAVTLPAVPLTQDGRPA